MVYRFAVALMVIIALAVSASAQNLVKSVGKDAVDGMALLINMNGYLCAEPIDVRKLALDGKFEVRCIEYRGGTGTVDYIVDLKAGTAVKR